MQENKLTIQQQKVIGLLAQGITISEAADVAGVHRNTVSNWRRAKSPAFREAWDHAQYEQTLFRRERYQPLDALALRTLRNLLSDSKTPAGIRFKTAITVLDKMDAPAPAQPHSQPGGELFDSMHNPAQPRPGKNPQLEQNTRSLGDAAGCASPAPTGPCTTLHNPDADD